MRCSLFDKSKFQYGPACFVSKALAGGPKRSLVYFPLGSGKTLSALHAARIFLSKEKKGKVLVLTTKTNIHTSWQENVDKYAEAESVDLSTICVHNIDWWSSESNTRVSHYNRLIRMLSRVNNNSRCSYFHTPWRSLIRATRLISPGGSKLRRNLCKELYKMRKITCLTPELSFIDMVAPKCPYLLIVDECHQYLNDSGYRMVVEQLCRRSLSSLLLSATPLNDASQQLSLFRLMGSRNITGRIMYVPPMKQKACIKHRYMSSKMTDEEWGVYCIEKTKRQDAYLSRSRQSCNTLSKWNRIFRTLCLDISTGATRNVVYSFFRGCGSDGFFQFLSNF